MNSSSTRNRFKHFLISSFLNSWTNLFSIPKFKDWDFEITKQHEPIVLFETTKKIIQIFNMSTTNLGSDNRILLNKQSNLKILPPHSALL
ncbi:hypothetical protein RCL_jg26278.t1 [Rhizophagus clarus]|uniref:Uncharacterized protein n=1 Tax=Rhizophagus clarus TaxID=94130 RepID=A0A8H3QD86_9GLOM|nr:hypothetical protein RCL_jg26278.t1 [Rhizophagus clarus]